MFNRKGTVAIVNGQFIDKKQSFFIKNSIVAATKSQGRDNLIESIITDALNNDMAVFVVQNSNTLPHNTIKNKFASHCSGRNFFCLDFTRQGTDAISLFKGDDPDLNLEVILNLMTCFGEVATETVGFVRRFFNEVFKLMRATPPPRPSFKLSTLYQFDANWMESQALSLKNMGAITQQEYDRIVNYVFLDVRGDRPRQRELENFCEAIKSKGFAASLSGSISYKELNTTQYISFITIDSVSCPQQSRGFLKVFIQKALYHMSRAPVNTLFLFEDVDVNGIDDFPILMRACQSSLGNNAELGSLVCFTTTKIKDFGSIDPRAFANTYFVFRQQVAEEAQEWAKTSGTHRVKNVTQNTQRLDSLSPNGGLISTIFGGVQVKGGETISYVDEYVIKPERFMSLADGECMVMIIKPNGCQYHMRVNWV